MRSRGQFVRRASIVTPRHGFVTGAEFAEPGMSGLSRASTFFVAQEGVDGRVKPGHDDAEASGRPKYKTTRTGHRPGRWRSWEV